ncbi:DUF6081 family protein [Micromonospora chersina]|uniref:Uncharacterized protein n=1 Tax=Micromonospora chersina TaxID=47854 RepID=A0A1C6U1C9_9ACTN|nr:DUF6081 family protein [Micromonospora chersina]SCL47846.1 hypothetical protein GA0070603_0462 [Micromonospora chersina]
MRGQDGLRRLLGAATAVVVVGCPGTASPATAAPGSRPSVVRYDSADLAEYERKWSNIYGPLDGATRSLDGGVLTVSDVPFKTGVDYSVYDHLKYMAVSNRTFPAPRQGSVEFSVDITARTPGATGGHVVHGRYGPPGSATLADPTARLYASPVLEGQQAAVVLNMIDFCTGQLFDWFVSGTRAFPLIERLPSTVTGNTTNPDCPGATEVGLDRAYTQIVREVPITPGVPHRAAIRYRQAGGHASVTYLLDGVVVARVDRVGVPLDRQGVPYTGSYPSLGAGEPLAGRIRSFSMAHGLFSLLDAFPFQYGCTPPDATGPGACDPRYAPWSVSIAPAERAFGQGAIGSFRDFTVRTVGR